MYFFPSLVSGFRRVRCQILFSLSSFRPPLFPIYIVTILRLNPYLFIATMIEMLPPASPPLSRVSLYSHMPFFSVSPFLPLLFIFFCFLLFLFFLFLFSFTCSSFQENAGASRRRLPRCPSIRIPKGKGWCNWDLSPDGSLAGQQRTIV